MHGASTYSSRPSAAAAAGALGAVTLALPLIVMLAINPRAALVLLLAGAGIAVAYARPTYGIAFSVFMLLATYEGVFLQFRIVIGRDGFPVSILDGLAALVGLSVLSLSLRARPMGVLHTAPLAAVGVLALYNGLALGNERYLIVRDITMIGYAILFFLAAYAVASDPRDRRVLIAAVVAGSTAAALTQIAFVVAAFGFHVALGGLLGLSRDATIVTITNDATDAFRDNYLRPSRVLFGLPLALFAYQLRPRPKWAGPVAVICIIAGIASLQRSVWLGMVIVVALTALRGGLTSTLPRIALITCVMIAAAGMVFPTALDVVQARIDEARVIRSDASIESRLSEADSAIEKVRRDGALLGSGLGAYADRYSFVLNSFIKESVLHNQYLAVLLKLGVLGIVAFAVMYAPVLRGITSSRRGDAPLTIAVIAFLVIGFAAASFAERIMGPLFATAAGIVMAPNPRPRAAPSTPVPANRPAIRPARLERVSATHDGP